MQSEPVRLAGSQLAWFGYGGATKRSEWVKCITAAIAALKGETT